MAEHLRVPLYCMSAGELGFSADFVEKNLNDIFDMIIRWKAVLLIDEVDVFFQTRTTQDLERNKLVFVFLRTLEYFKGVLLLITNRASDIDEVFESRIHLTIKYPPLDAAARRFIWTNFIDVDHDGNTLTDEDIISLAKEEINGRQIKNVVKTAQLLARTSQGPLTEEQIRMVLCVIKENRLTFGQSVRGDHAGGN